MKTCRNCGASNSADDRFCGNCGAVLPETDDQQPGAQGDQRVPAQSESKGNDPSGQPGFASIQSSSGAHGQQPPTTDQYGNPVTGQSGQPMWGMPPSDNPGGQPQSQYGQPTGGQYGQQPYGQPPEGQYGQQSYGQQQYDPQGQPYGQPGYGQRQGEGQQPYSQQTQGNPYGDQTPQPWYATGSSDTPPPPVKPRGRSRWKTALLAIVAVFLVICIGSIVFAFTPYGMDQIERAGTWAAEEQTRQAGD